MSRGRAVGGGLALAVVLLGAALWLFTLDVYSDTGRQYDGVQAPPAGGSFCGSAYDVTLLEGDGYLGGEIPDNQAQLDRECVRKAGVSVAAASVFGTLGAGLLALTLLRRRTREPAGT